VPDHHPGVDDVVLRPAVAADAARLTAIAHAAKRHWGYADELIELWRADLTITPDVIAAGLVCCAVREAAIAGFYALSRDGATFELEHMWVDPAHMGRGHGAHLFQHAVATARAHGGTLLRIASDPHAEGFYQRLGAERVGAEPSALPDRSLPLLVVALTR
jgi:GNAT superfamily N-acetyltransferase